MKPKPTPFTALLLAPPLATATQVKSSVRWALPNQGWDFTS